MELIRTIPEAQGMASSTILRFIEQWEMSGAEPHGLCIVKNGAIIAEGHWTPYRNDLPHGNQSLTKTYIATGIGILVGQGKLRLEDLVLSFFPEEAPPQPSDYLKMLTIRHVLTMSMGMEHIPEPTADWIRAVLNTPIVHRPGTRFFYNRMCTNLLGAVIRKVSGSSVHEFLAEHLFSVIGIPGQRVRWLRLRDGTEVCSGGSYTTTQDNARLMMLYLQEGRWQDRLVVPSWFAREAAQPQIATDSNVEGVRDCQQGYSYQIWMCSPQGVYRADGGLGQYAVVFPRHNLVVSVHQTAKYPELVEKTAAILYEHFADFDEISQDSMDSKRLADRLETLALPCASRNEGREVLCSLSGQRLQLPKPGLPLSFSNEILTGRPESLAQTLLFELRGEHALLTYTDEEGEKQITLNLGGGWSQVEVASAHSPVTLVAGNAWQTDERTLCVTLRWLQTCFRTEYRFTLHEGAVEIQYGGTGFLGADDVWGHIVVPFQKEQ